MPRAARLGRRSWVRFASCPSVVPLGIGVHVSCGSVIISLSLSLALSFAKSALRHVPDVVAVR
eukprot:scaffold18278_cov56-Phaeocystis_antarctica.AAC.2